MRRLTLADLPMLLPLTAVIVGILLFFPRDFQQAPIPYVSQAADNMLVLRSQLLQQYREAGISGEAYAILAAMTLGEKALLSQEVRELFATTGASHILALSGLHLGIIYMMITLLVPNRRWRTLSQLVTIVGIWAFAFLTGLSASIVRAATMLTVYGLLAVGHRERTSVNVLAFTAFAILIVSPMSLYNVGFQMSFLAVLGILLFNPLLSSLIAPHVLQRHTLLKWIWGMTTVSVSAQIGVAPLIAYYFHRFSTYFLLSNMVVIPCAWLLLLGSMLLLVSHSTAIGMLLSETVWLMTRLLDRIASLPGASIDHLHPNRTQIVLTYILTGCIFTIINIYASTWSKRGGNSPQP